MSRRSATCRGAIRARTIGARARTASVASWRTRSPTTPTRCVLAAAADGDRRHAALRRPPRPAAAHRPAAVDEDGCCAWQTAPDALDAVRGRPHRRVGLQPDIPSDRITDVSGHDRHGTTVNLPTRGVTGHDFTRRRRPTGAGDPASTARSTSIATTSRTPAGTADFELTIPADLPSGIYAAWLQAGDDEDYLPFTVRPPRGTTRSRIAVLMSTVTYVTYANFTDIGRDAWRDGRWHGRRDRPAVRRPDALRATPTATSRRTRCTASTTSTRTGPASATARCCGRSSTCARSSATGRSNCAGALPGRPLPGRLARAEGHRRRLPDRPRPPRRGRRPASAVHRRRVELASRVLDGADARRARRLPRRRRPVHVPRRQLAVRRRERRSGQAARARGAALGHGLAVRDAAGRAPPLDDRRAGRDVAATAAAARMRWSASGRRVPGSIAARRTGGSPTPTTRGSRSSSRASTTT